MGFENEGLLEGGHFGRGDGLMILTLQVVRLECFLTTGEDGAEEKGSIFRANGSHFAFKASFIFCNFRPFRNLVRNLIAGF